MAAQLNSHKPTGIWQLSSLQDLYTHNSKASLQSQWQSWDLSTGPLALISCVFSAFSSPETELIDVSPISWRKERHKAKMKNSSRDLHSDRVSTLLAGPALQATALTTGWFSVPERVRKQKAHDAQGESGTGLQWQTRQLSRGTSQAATKGLFMFWFSHPPLPQGISNNGWAQNTTLSSIFFALFGLPAAAVTYFWSCPLQKFSCKAATCSTRTAQLGTEECDRTVIKSDLSRQFHHKTRLLPHKLKQKLLWGRLLLGWCQHQLLHPSNRNDGRVLKSFTRY